MATNHEQDLLWVYNPTTTPFTVQWGGHPYTVKSNEKKVFPRFIAEHFAKHLTDAILLRQEKKLTDMDGKPHALVNSTKERPRVLNLIILGVYSYFYSQDATSGTAIAKMVDEVQQNADMSQAPEVPTDDTIYTDMGLVPNNAIGTLIEPETPDEDEIADALDGATIDPDAPAGGDLLPENDPDATPPPVPGTTTTPTDPPTPGKPKERSRDELLQEAEVLGIQNAKKMTTEKLREAIKNF